MTAGTTIRNYKWHYQEKQGNTMRCLAAATGLFLFLVVLLLMPNTEAVVSILLPVSFVVAALVLSRPSSSTVELDPDKGEIVKTTKYLLFTSSKRYRLREFDEVRLLTLDEPVEDGYRANRYALVLSGKARSLELLSPKTEAEGRAARQELAEYMGFQ